MYLLYLHAIMMVLGTLFIFSGVIAARFFKQKRWWLKWHKRFGSAAAISLIVGFILVFTRLFLLGANHFRTPHSFIGIAAICLSVVTLALGHLQFHARRGRASIRTFHRLSGGVTLSLTVINIITGWIMAL